MTGPSYGFSLDDTQILGTCPNGHLHGYAQDEIIQTGGHPPMALGANDPQTGILEGYVVCAEPGCELRVEVTLV